MTTHTKVENRSDFRRTLLSGVVLAIVAIAVVLVGCSSASTTTTGSPSGSPTTDGGIRGGGGATTQVNMQGMAFSPQTVTINVGDSVNWRNMDEAPHNAVAVDKSWQTSTFSTGESGSVTFTTAGTFPYICTIHPNMTGTVIAQ